MRILRSKYRVKNMQSKRLPVIVDRAMWKKVTKGQPVRWDKEVERIWKEIGGNCSLSQSNWTRRLSVRDFSRIHWPLTYKT